MIASIRQKKVERYTKLPFIVVTKKTSFFEVFSALVLVRAHPSVCCCELASYLRFVVVFVHSCVVVVVIATNPARYICR